MKNTLIKIIIFVFLIFIILPVQADEEALMDYHAFEIAKQYARGCEYEKAKAVHDYLIKNVEYDYLLSENSFRAYGALVEGKAVCQGYSFAYYEILKHLNIDCNVCIGRAGDGIHAWNLVTVNGIGYFVDVTWDDKDDGKIYYDWFMLTGIKDHYTWFLLY